MKIGIATYFKIKNYGSALQAFALRKFLMQQGYSALFLNVKEQKPINDLFHKLYVGTVTLFKCAFNASARKTQAEIKALKKKTTEVISKNTAELFSNFEQEFLPSINIGRLELKKMAKSDEFGAFICGSDQIWSPLSPHLSGFKFLSFAPKEKRIAFSPSFGVSKIPSYNESFVKKSLMKIDDISVREFDGAKIIKELTGKDALVTIDPTMLLTGEEWRNIYKEHSVLTPDEKYILCYFFDEPDEKDVLKITEFARLKNLKIKVLSCSNKFLIENGAELIDAGPMEFLALTDNAEYVFTNSFHGSVFSVLFEKKFIAFARNHSDTVKQTSRIETLLKRVNADCFYNGETDGFVFPNTELFESSVKDLRKTSAEYLTNCLEKRRLK